MPIQTITSRDNSLIRRVRLAARQPSGSRGETVVAEGLHVLEEAASSSCEIEALVMAEGFGRTAREEALVQALQERRVRICRVSNALLGTLSGVLSPQGAVALVKVAARRIQEVPLGQRPLILCICGVQDPGNFGTLLRTAAAFGATLVCTVQGSVSARNLKCIRSSAGAYFKIPVAENLQPAELHRLFRTHGISAFRADPKSNVRLSDTDFRGPTAFLLGNESHGLSGKDFARLPAVGIPMVSAVESLNVAIAGGILLFEAFRQREENRR